MAYTMMANPLLHAAKLLGARDISLNTVGLGGTTPPPDLAILEVENPDAVSSMTVLTGHFY